MRLSFGRHQEDVLIQHLFEDVPRGVYVDVGASHPVVASNTYALYQLGWRGICLDPRPNLAPLWASVRPRDIFLPLAAGATDGSIPLHLIPGGEGSTVVAELAQAHAAAGILSEVIAAPQARLDRILAQHGATTIQVLSLDVEGAEAAVLEGLDLGRWRPALIVVEAVSPRVLAPTHEAWADRLLQAGYAEIAFDGVNRYYLAHEECGRRARLDKLAAQAREVVHQRPPLSPDAILERLAEIEALAAPEAAERELMLLSASAQHHPAAWTALGNLYVLAGRWTDAETAFWRAVAAAPDVWPPWFNLLTSIVRQPDCAGRAEVVGRTLLDVAGRQGMPEDGRRAAFERFSRFFDEAGDAGLLLQAATGWFERGGGDLALQYQGRALNRLKRWPEAEALWGGLRGRWPGNSGVAAHLGVVKVELGHFEEGVRLYEEVLAVEAHNTSIMHNLAYALRFIGRGEEAVAWLDRALALDPENADLLRARSVDHLHRDRYDPGLALYEARLQTADAGTPALADYSRALKAGAQLWLGEPLQGRTLCICPEQGRGDWIMASRFLPLLAERLDGPVRYAVLPEFERYADALPFGGDLERIAAADIGRGRLVLPMMSLMHRIGVRSSADLPPPVAPLIDPADLAAWGGRALEMAAPVVGVCWRGSVLHPIDGLRSIPFETFISGVVRPLQQAGVRVASLQIDATPEEQRRLADIGVDLRWSEAPVDWLDSAARVAALDAVCAVDTAVVHLAGTLGTPVVMLNRPAAISDWRWVAGASRSGWYPSLRIVSQRRLHDWDDPCREAVSALLDLSAR